MDYNLEYKCRWLSIPYYVYTLCFNAGQQTNLAQRFLYCLWTARVCHDFANVSGMEGSINGRLMRIYHISPLLTTPQWTSLTTKDNMCKLHENLPTLLCL